MTHRLMALTARFDVNQIDDGINWLFSEVESLGSSDRSLTDSSWNRDIVFRAGEKFRIAIAASDRDHTGLESIEIVDCCLITRPRILSCGPGMRTRYAPPSLFVDDGKPLGALCQIDPTAFSVHSTGIDPEKGRNITLVWDGHMNVGNVNGFWELSFYVTVLIKRAREEAAQLRVFYFDPEGEVSNGSDPP